MGKRRAIVLSALVLLAAVLLFISHWLRPYDLDTEVRAARAAGAPVSPADFPQTPVPDARNAAPEYNALVALLNRKPLVSNPAIAEKAFVPREHTRLLRDEIRSRPDISALVLRAASKPELFYRHTWSPDEKFPYYARMRDAARWLRRESLLLARDGRYGEAVRHQALGFTIARQAGMDPPLIGYLVSQAVEATTLDGLEDILREAGPNAAVAAAVRAAVAAYRPTYDLTRSLCAEMALGLTVIDQIRQLAAEDDASRRGGPPRENLYVSKLWLKPNKAMYIHWMTSEIVASRLTGPARLTALRQSDRDMERMLDRKPGTPAAFITAILAPVAAKALTRETESAAKRAVVSTAAVVLAYRARNGKYPATLDQAVSPAPIDPLTGAGLSYVSTGTSFSVSAHPDLSGFSASRARTRADAFSFTYP